MTHMIDDSAPWYLVKPIITKLNPFQFVHGKTYGVYQPTEAIPRIETHKMNGNTDQESVCNPFKDPSNYRIPTPTKPNITR